MKLAIAIFLGTLALAAANCQNSCSLHGTCGANDKCTCHRNWQGTDCSERKCKFDKAWVDTPSADNVAHGYAECSAKGVCDRKAGACKCYPGYEGEACQRTTCPNSCSGHGTCEYIEDLADDTASQVGGAAGRIYTKWDEKKIQGCKCDATWGGTDCSERLCLMGDDPLTTVGSTREVQTLTISNDGSGALTGSFTLSFQDKYNAVWTTRPISAVDCVSGTQAQADDSALMMKQALEALPNQAIDTVTVVATKGTNVVSYAITFSGINTGPQNALMCHSAGCAADGCQPNYAGLSGGAYISCTVARTTPGNQDLAVCSNRGQCDKTTGLCTCHSGYYGESCQHQTVLL